MPALTVKKLYLAKSIEELAEKATVGNLKKNTPLQLCNAAGKVIKEAELSYLDKDEEKSYLLYMKFIELVLQLQKRPDIRKVESSFDLCVKKLDVAFSKAEELKESLAKRYAVLREAADNEQKEKKDVQAKSVSQSEDAQSKENKAVISEKEKMYKSKDDLLDVLKKTISSEQLFNLLTNCQSSVIIMDVRLEADFSESHIKHSGCVNIPAGILSPGITAARLEEKLSSSSLSKWKQRGNVDLIVLTDSDSKGDDVLGSPIYSLKEAMCKWDQSCDLKREPLVLNGGYEDWMLRYPMYTTKAIKFQMFGKKEIKREPTPDVTEVKYPDLDEAFLKAPSKNVTEVNENEKDVNVKCPEIGMPNKIVNGWVSDTSALMKKENASTPSIDRKSKPKFDKSNKWVTEHTEHVNSNSILERQNSLEKSSNYMPSMPTDYSEKDLQDHSEVESPVRNLPVVDRTLKPSVTVKTTQLQVNGVDPASTNTNLIGGLKKEENKAKESLSNVTELLDKEKEFEKLRLQKELEAEESKRIEIQKQEILLMNRIKELEDESLKMEQEFKKIQDENLNMKKLLEEQRDKDHQKQKEAEIEFIEQKRKNAMVEVNRLREERKKREREEKKQREEIGATSQQQKNVSKEQVMKETNDKDTKSQNGMLQEYAKHRPSEITIPLSKNRGGTSDGTSRGLTRSYSSPNIAQMVVQEDNEDFPQKIPVVDRSLKPKTRDHAPIMANEISTIRQRNLNPIYGNNQGRPVTGIRNLGNTCFMNSTIQCLSNTAALAQYFTSGQYRYHINRENKQGTRGEIAEEFAIIIQALWMGQYKSFSPKDFKNTVSKYLPICIGNEQQDSHEFLVVLMDKLHADLNQPETNDPVSMPNLESLPDSAAQETFWNYHRSINRSKVSDLFEGLLRSTLTCLHCKKTSSSYEVFSCLSLPISASSRCKLIDCLQTFLKPEKMSGEGAWDCPKCKQKKEAEKIMSICQLPNILVIQLKRFSYEGLWRRKLQTNVDFSTVLEMPYIINTAKYYRKYSLYGVVNHFGTLEGGHYTAYCKNYNSGKWYKYDDHEVNEMSISDVKTPAAYLLFYASVDTKVISVL